MLQSGNSRRRDSTRPAALYRRLVKVRARATLEFLPDVFSRNQAFVEAIVATQKKVTPAMEVTLFA